MNESLKEPLVSICCLTYNHAPYIRDTIEGFLIQKTNFPFEIIIHDDASTDGTDEIIREYEAKYPDIIKPIYETENQHSKELGKVTKITYSAACGKYIALCEGDDYWTDPYKLQKQVDFLEENEEYAVCFHRYKIVDNETKSVRDDNCSSLFVKQPEIVDIDTNLFLNQWVTQPLTMVFRKDCLNLTLYNQYHFFRDMHLIYHLLQKGKGCILSFYGGIYREHLNGIHSKRPLTYQCEIGIVVAKELYDYNKSDILLKKNYIKTLNWSINVFINNDYNKIKVLNYIFIHLFLSKDIKKFIKNFINLIKSSKYY